MQWGPKYNRGPIYIKEWQNLFTHYACTFLTHASLSADRFHTKTSGVSRLHGTVVKFHTGVKFSLQYNNWGGLKPM